MIKFKTLKGEISFYNFFAVLTLLTILSLIICFLFYKEIKQQEEFQLRTMNNFSKQVLENQNQQLKQRVSNIENNFIKLFNGNLEYINDNQDPQLIVDGKTINSNLGFIDEFADMTDSIATVFARQGSDFKRINTSLKKSDGTRDTQTSLGSNHPAYQKIINGHEYEGLETIDNKTYMTKYLPLRDKKSNIIGIAFVGIDFSNNIETFKNTLVSLTSDRGGHFIVVDTSEENKGKLLLSGSHNIIDRVGKSIIDLNDVNGKPIIETMIKNKSGLMDTVWYVSAEKQIPKLSIYSTYEPWNWLIISNTSTKAIMNDTYHIGLILAILSLVAIILLSLFLNFFSNFKILKPILSISNTVDKIAKGDLTVKITDVKSNNELGLLAKAINNISENFRNIVHSVKEKSNSINVSSEEILQGNYQLSSRTEQQAAAVEETAATMTELQATIKNNADNSSIANSLTLETSEIVGNGEKQVTQLVAIMDNVKNSSDKITDITNMINSIAFQTNLLSLNAAVEAARAGEHGKGFAVVANEVRALAAKCSESAKEIKILIETSSGEVSKAVSLAMETHKTMEVATKKISNVVSTINEIKLASQEQSNGVTQVSEAMNNIEIVVQQNAALVEELAANSQQLKENSNQLMTNIEMFKIDKVIIANI